MYQSSCDSRHLHSQLCVTTLVYSQNDQEYFVLVDVSVLVSISSFTFLGQVSYVDIGQPRALGQFLS